MRIILVSLAAFGVLGCAVGAPQGEDNSLDQMREDSLASIDAAACEASGGEVRQEGMLGLWRCVRIYGDAGATCQSADDCEGRCLADDSVTDYDSAPGSATGLCEADDSPFGCYAEIEDGVLAAALCVD